MPPVRPVVALERSLTLIYPDGLSVRLDPASLNAILEALVNYGWLVVNFGSGREAVTGARLALTSDEEGCWFLTEMPMAGCSSNGKLRLDDGNEI